MPSIFLVRHGQVLPGIPENPPLSPLGHQQAQAAAEALAAQGVSPTLTVSGSLARQQATVAAIAVGASDPRWNEYDVPALLASHASDITIPQPHLDPRGFQEALDQALRVWMSSPDDGPGSWLGLRARVDAALGEVATGLASGQSAVVVTSGGPIAAVCTGLLGLDVDGTIALHRVLVNAGITRVMSGRAGLRLASVNEQGHLHPDLLTYR